jgi:ferritin
MIMQLSASIAKALNDQIRKEFSSEYVYLAMSAWFAERTLDGFANWMRVQAGEEHLHAMKLFDYLLDRGGVVALQGIEAPARKWKTPLQVFEAARQHEAMVSASINQLYAQAVKELDYPTQAMLQWFLTEQVEEEKTSSAVVERVRMAGDNASALLMLDRELGQRGPEAGGEGA